MLKKNSSTLGIIIIVVGLLLLLQNIGIGLSLNLSIGLIFNTLWPLILIYFGFKRIKRGQNDLFSYILIAFGIYLVANALTDLHPIFGLMRNYFLPLAIILTGLVLIVKPKSKHSSYQYDTSAPEQFDQFADDGYTYQNDNDSFFGNSSHTNSNFQAADYVSGDDDATATKNKKVAEHNYNTSFNSNHIVLNESDLISGLNVVNLHCTMGEIQLSLPKSVNVLMDGQLTFGQINFLNKKYDGIKQNSKAKYRAPVASDKRIHVYATATFAEISIVLH